MPDLHEQFVHLGMGASAIVQPPFTGMDWYDGYGARHDAADGIEGRLVSLYRFDASWDSWEMHPHGTEVVICTDGQMTLHQDMGDGNVTRVTLSPGGYAINPPGCWHTADIIGEASAIFITAGLGTEHRPR